jgi:hypothetical protein
MSGWIYLIHVANNSTNVSHPQFHNWKEELQHDFRHVGTFEALGYNSFHKINDLVKKNAVSLILDTGGFPQLFAGPMESFSSFLQYLVLHSLSLNLPGEAVELALSDIPQNTLLIIEVWEDD